MMNDEKLITCKLIEYLENSFQFDFIAREVPFFSMRRRADLVAVDRQASATYGFEIKSDRDTLSRLGSQLEDYRLTFNYVYVVTTEKYVEMVKNYGAWFGVLVVDSKGFIFCLRKARKRGLLHDTNCRPLQKVGEIEENINQQYINWLCSRYEPIYQVFIKERSSNKTTDDDIKILSLRSDVINLR
ncbi:sce7726 family protein [Shewanella sp. SM20]|uniref:sce7726 family protein n=1 Tax=Shewanella sp. SM20 TaxID=2912792 RepID=UPI0021D9D45B|nr:sce7726 family protein [Shewanella sp. SM20]MCU8090739.1 sce7726 family protein [Shewanella sp. SM20]